MEQQQDSRPPVLEVRRVSQQRQGKRVLEDISLCCRQGELTLLTGPSGGGKSTLLRLLNRLDEPQTGDILLHGRDIRSLPPVQLRCRVAMMLQKPTMFPGTVLDNLQSSFRLRQQPLPAVSSDPFARTLALCGLETDLLERAADRLSIGQQQRVSLARALLTEPEVLLLDEPTSALDRPSADRLGELLRRLCREQQKTLVMVSHDLRLSERIADQVLFLSGGRIVERGSARILRQPESAELQTFLHDPSIFAQEEEP